MEGHEAWIAQREQGGNRFSMYLVTPFLTLCISSQKRLDIFQFEITEVDQDFHLAHATHCTHGEVTPVILVARP